MTINMTVTGIHIEMDANGAMKKVTFDMEKYGKILSPILEKLGVIEDNRLQKSFYSLDEAKEETKKRLRELCRNENL